MRQAAPQDEPWLSEQDGRVIIRIPMQFRRRGGRKDLIVPPDRSAAASTPVFKPLAVAVARAHRWMDLLDRGSFGSINELAEAVGVDRGYIGRLLNLTLLAPDIVERILDGQEPSGLSLKKLTRIMPLSWDAQRRVLETFAQPDSRDD